MIKIKGYKILNNIYALYIVFFITIINLFTLMYNKNYKSVILFSILTLTIYFFNKNMIVILLMSIIIVNSINLFTPKWEGYDNKKVKSTKTKSTKDKESNDDDLIIERPDIEVLDIEEGYANNEDDIVNKLGNIALNTLLNSDDMSDNTVNNAETLQETELNSNKLTKKINSVSDKDTVIYNKINELNSKMNELTALIK
jgi:hypothetical protein